jgi:peptide/nickel transport system ATP-binding protein
MSGNENAVAIEAKGLRKEYLLNRTGVFQPRKKVLAVDDVSFEVRAGTTFGLVGESGSGKTTIAKLLLKLEAPTSGQLYVEEEEIFSQNAARHKAYRRD